MRLCYVGYVVEGSNENYRGISTAGNKMQRGILKGLSQLNGCEVESISIPPYATYPNNDFYLKCKDGYVGNVNNTEIGFINVPVLKQLHQAFNIFRALVSKRNELDKVLCFNAYFPIALPVLLFSFIYKKPVVAFIADVPLDDNKNRPRLSKYIYIVFFTISKILLSRFKKVVVLNKKAALRFCPRAKYIVVEGGVESFENDVCSEISARLKMTPKIVVYTGALTDYSGIKNLVNAFRFLNSEDLQLHVYGGGYLEKWLVSEVKTIPNVIYQGSVDNSIAIDAQKDAWLLVNPRVIIDDISNYTFPSKLLEYMQSGTAVLTTNISGITEEYKNAVFITEDDTAEGFAKAIQGILQADDSALSDMRINSWSLVKRKTWNHQTKKIFDFLRNEEKI
jgi:glycosyltransferase involved in cell wall biosynthesis